MNVVCQYVYQLINAGFACLEDGIILMNLNGKSGGFILEFCCFPFLGLMLENNLKCFSFHKLFCLPRPPDF